MSVLCERADQLESSLFAQGFVGDDR
jgi:hypothetical protein